MHSMLCFRTPFGSQHVNGPQTLQKYAGEALLFYYFFHSGIDGEIKTPS